MHTPFLKYHPMNFPQLHPSLSSGFLKSPISPETATESFVSLSIFYESLSYTITTESPQIDWISLLGRMGGNLSLVLGVSFFSLCELVEVLIEIYFIEKKLKF